jgi:hypothetical protein
MNILKLPQGIITSILKNTDLIKGLLQPFPVKTFVSIFH